MRVMAGGEPFEYVGSQPFGVLLLHGFTGAPFEMRPLGSYLAERGVGSIGVRLRGHGTHPNDMLRYRHSDWIEDAEDGFQRLASEYGLVFIAGLSMGGTLALNLAARHDDDERVAGVIPIGAPIRLIDWRLRLLPVLTRAVRWHAWGQPDIKDRSAWDRHVSYRRFRTPSLVQLLALIRETAGLLGRIHQPAFIAQARVDGVVPSWNAQLIYDRISSADKSVLLLDNCYHVVTLDFAAEQLNAEIYRFVQSRSRRRGEAERTMAASRIEIP